MNKNNLVVVLSQKEINSVAGGSIWRKAGKFVQEINREADKILRQAGEEIREAKNEFLDGMQKAQGEDQKPSAPADTTGQESL